MRHIQRSCAFQLHVLRKILQQNDVDRQCLLKVQERHKKNLCSIPENEVEDNEKNYFPKNTLGTRKFTIQIRNYLSPGYEFPVSRTVSILKQSRSKKHNGYKNVRPRNGFLFFQMSIQRKFISA